jgi:hypothetical protein
VTDHDHDEDGDELFPDSMTLGEAREWLREQLADKGAPCPCCTQLSKVYHRPLYGAMAAGLITCYQQHHREWFHMRTATDYHGGDHSKLRYWGLIEEELELRPDGGRAGWWRITEDGVAFVLGQTAVPRHARVYDGKCLGLDDSKGLVTVRDVLGDKFDYDDLMTAPGGYPPII